jgi:hypothetical protein
MPLRRFVCDGARDIARIRAVGSHDEHLVVALRLLVNTISPPFGENEQA